MKQRVAIARAFATRADLILMDEPFVRHNLEEAVFLGDRVLILSAKPATIVADIAIDLPRPRDMLSAQFTELRRRCLLMLHEQHAQSSGARSNH